MKNSELVKVLAWLNSSSGTLVIMNSTMILSFFPDTRKAHLSRCPEQHIVKRLCSLKNVVLIHLLLDHPVALWSDDLRLGLFIIFFLFNIWPCKRGIKAHIKSKQQDLNQAKHMNCLFYFPCSQVSIYSPKQHQCF